MTEKTQIFLSTYRLQFNKDFNFDDAKALVPYLARLGVSHAYLSPILRARKGSTHGYDTVDHQQLNPELGTLDQFRGLAAAFRQAGMGILLDFVPNHMGVGGSENHLWLDVLRHGRASRYADWFDIDWAPPHPHLHGKVLVPFLGVSYADALAKGDIALRTDEDFGFAVWANNEQRLPIRPEDCQALLDDHGTPASALSALNDPRNRAALDDLVARQHWRLAHHLMAADEINYRRFFISAELASIRIERPEVFDHAHRLVFALIEEGLVDGLRIDHIDGLHDPAGYLQTLRRKLPRPVYLLVEKILAPHERLPAGWPVDGTTGYEFGAMVTRLLVDPAAEPALTDIYRRFIGPHPGAIEQTYICKRRVMDNELAAELFALARRVAGLAHSVAATRDLTENGLRKGLREIIAWLTVYRTYFDAGAGSARDRREIGYAVAKARRSARSCPPAIFAFLQRLLSADRPAAYDPARTRAVIARFQQYSGPVMAKGHEDTALYRYNRLIALNEVGAHPETFSIGAAAFHDANRRRLAAEPFAMLTTSTHDTKRGEDTRTRIAAIADRPDLWGEAVFAWRDLLAADGADDIDANELYFFFQTLLGAWPDEIDEPHALLERLQGAMIKSAREARVNTDWNVGDAAYEARLTAFIAAALSNRAFMDHFARTHAILAAIGRRKSLIQIALKLTVPGIPDIYRGAEVWEQSLVDPDNRRSVDFAALRARLDRVEADPSAADPASADGKLFLTTALLNLRKRNPDLFLKGSYEPLMVGDGQRLLAFQRRHQQASLLLVADLSAGHTGRIEHPLPLPPGRFQDLIFGELHEGWLKATHSLDRMGVVILVQQSGT
jgi:(1->4)-alpha-D-glucan 1-alpha-D-glucosylmutase